MCGMATNQLFDGIFFFSVVVVMLHSISIICIPLIWPLVKLFAQVLLWQKHAVHKCPSSAGGLGFQFKLCQTFRFNSGISVQFWFSLGSCCRRSPRLDSTRLDCILYLFTLHWLTHNELTRNHIRAVCMNAENSVRVRARAMKFCIYLCIYHALCKSYSNEECHVPNPWKSITLFIDAFQIQLSALSYSFTEKLTNKFSEFQLNPQIT